MKRLDLTTLRAATEKEIETSVGTVVARRLGRLEYLELLPGVPPEILGPPRTGKETDEERRQISEAAVERETAWVKAMPPAERVARRAEMLEALYMAVARAVIEPKMSVEDVKRLGDDAHVIFQELQSFWRAEAKAEINGGAERPKEPEPEPEPEPVSAG
jgi:hypothetical protein